MSMVRTQNVREWTSTKNEEKREKKMYNEWRKCKNGVDVVEEN